MKNKEFYHIQNPTWCPGCGLYGIFDALKRAASRLEIAPEQLVIVSGIGCHGRLNSYFKSYAFHGLHGRVLPVATGVKLSNPSLFVLGVSGDGDAYSIGLSHFIHTARKNISISYLVTNNRVYALTQGQTSPTSFPGYVSISTPYGSKDYPIDGPQLALAAGGTFVARGFSGEVTHLATLIEKAMRHRGFSLVDILSPCVTYNRVNTYNWYKKNISFLEHDSSYDAGNKALAWQRLAESEKIPLGLIYLEEKPAFEELVLPEKEKSLAFSGLGVPISELEKIMEKFR